ncbi:unnamed protein product [Trichobilharzia regenti]|nr:unnamed protein product [Trichobilharzia regenti]
MFGAGPGCSDSGMLNGSVGPPRSSGMMPPPPPDYSSGMPSSASNPYPPGSDLKASPLHGGNVLQQQHMGSGPQGQAPPPPPQYVPSGAQHSGSSGGPPSSMQSVCGGSNPSPAGGPGSVQFPVNCVDNYSFCFP